MNAPLARRNDPCPCGSGLRFKECHGRIDAPAAAAGPDASALHERGWRLCQQGRAAEGLALLERAHALRPDDGELAARVGLMRYVMGDIGAAVRVLRHALTLVPADAEAHSNLALALRDSGEFEAALGEVRRAIELKPSLAEARINLAMCLLALGRFAEAWPVYAWRPDARLNLRDPMSPNSWPHAAVLPADRDAVTLHGEQGLGDVLFFLRFAARLRERGAALRFWGDARLGAMLTRSRVVEEAFGGADAPPGTQPSHLVWVGDLPAMLGVGGETPPPLVLVADEARTRALRARLASLGSPPYVALTWRAGLERRGLAVLAKAIAPERLGAALAGLRATFVSVQRAPAGEETARMAQALDAPLHDLAAINDDLDDVLALMGLVDEYVGVSNTNVHLRAGAGKASRVLVPFPPEWRWGAGDSSSPWFPENPVYREDRATGWDGALARLRSDLEANR